MRPRLCRGLHGRGTHPDREQVAGTLSLLMPLLDKEASYYDYVENQPGL